ncbi:hypothetical protein EDB83DRAFT_2670496 [Lactarius deliciosus]|nr:hypothetical protein EDB83DRAFT_2670496 [Lactarius deliciosus]
MVRVFHPGKSMETRSASLFSGAHSDEVDFVAWNPTHPELFCSSSQKDRRIVFWDARRIKPTFQQCALKISPVQVNYAPGGRSLLYVSSGNQLFFMSYGKDSDDSTVPAQWSPMDRSPLTASSAMFNHTGDSLILTHMSEHAIRIVDVPSLALRENLAAHVGRLRHGRARPPQALPRLRRLRFDREFVRHQRVDCCSYDHRLRLVENWREDANGIMLLSGLLSATVAGFLSQSYLSSQTSSQDVSAFYPSQLYQFQAASSNSSGTPPPAPPNPTSAPTGAHMLWFASLVLSLATAVFATLIQEWSKRWSSFWLASLSFYRSTRVQDLTEVLRESNTDRLPQAILAFIDHSFSSDLVSDTTRRQRINISLKAIQADSYLLQRTFYHALGFVNSAGFTCIDFILLADQYTNDDVPDVRFLARCIVPVAINRLGDYHHTGERWAGIIQ